MRTLSFLLVVVFAGVSSVAAQTCAILWGQCGGQGWTGATCCAAGSTCVYSNPYYSQCLPASTTSTATTTTTTVPTTTRTTTTTVTVTTTSPRTTTTTTTTSSPRTTTTTTTTSSPRTTTTTTTTTSPTTTTTSPRTTTTTVTSSRTTTTTSTSAATPTGLYVPPALCSAMYQACGTCCNYGLSCQSNQCLTCPTGQVCGIPSNWYPIPARPSSSTGAPAPPAGYKPVPPFSTRGRHIIDSNGYRIKFTGVNWFGCETSIQTFHGLWSSVHWKETIAHMRRLGFTLLRVPFSNDFLVSGRMPTSVNTYAQPDLANLTSIQILDAVINYAGSLGMYTLLDRHATTADTRTPLWYDASISEARWISDWQLLATRYKSNLYVVGADLHNEPHSTACWGCGDTARDWRLAAIRAGNAIQAIAPHWLIVVEGTDSQNGDGAGATWWGGNLEQAAAKPITLTVPNKVVYSPHEYGNSVYQQAWFSDPAFPTNLPTVWYHFWAHLYYLDFAPVLIGEFGSTLVDPKDVTWMTELVKFMGGTDSDGMSWTYWSWNPDSGDTGGLVTNDWATEETAKINILKPGMFTW